MCVQSAVLERPRSRVEDRAVPPGRNWSRHLRRRRPRQAARPVGRLRRITPLLGRRLPTHDRVRGSSERSKQTRYTHHAQHSCQPQTVCALRISGQLRAFAMPPSFSVQCLISQWYGMAHTICLRNDRYLWVNGWMNEWTRFNDKSHGTQTVNRPLTSALNRNT